MTADDPRTQARAEDGLSEEEQEALVTAFRKAAWIERSCSGGEWAAFEGTRTGPPTSLRPTGLPGPGPTIRASRREPSND